MKDPIPPPATPGCTRNDDCDPGQECREGACFGGPQSATFAAEVFPPSSRSDLPPRVDIATLQISTNGRVDIALPSSVEVSGYVLLRSTDLASSAAKVVFHRPSRIPDGPDYSVSVDALAGRDVGEAAFRLQLVPNITGESYDVTIYPDDGTLAPPADGAQVPSALAPPKRIQVFHIEKDIRLPVTLDEGLKHISGRVRDGLGYGLSGLYVRAYGRLSSSSPLELVSSTGITDDGIFDLYMPFDRAALSFEVRVTPKFGLRIPSLVRQAIRVGGGPDSVLNDINYPSLPPVTQFSLPVTGTDASGARKPVVGATATFRTAPLTVGSDTLTYEDQSTVGQSGAADLDLIPGSADLGRDYTVTVQPLGNSRPGIRWDYTVNVGATGGDLPPLILPSRAQVSGRILDASQAPAAHMTVRAQLSDAFLGDLPADIRDRVAALVFPEATTDEEGRFTMWLDQQLIPNATVAYDLELVPPSGSQLPRWWRDNVALPLTATRLDLDDIVLPRASLVSGNVLDSAGQPVADAEVRVYMQMPDQPVRLETVAKSDKDGRVRLVLPSP